MPATAWAVWPAPWSTIWTAWKPGPHPLRANAEDGAGVVALVSGSATSGDIATIASWSWTGPNTTTAFGTRFHWEMGGNSLADVLVAAPT